MSFGNQIIYLRAIPSLMRVIIVHPAVPIYGGAEIVITKLLYWLNKKGIDTKLLMTSVPPDMKKDIAEDHLVIPVKQRKPFPPVWSIDLTEIVALNRWLIKNKDRYDVINLHNYPVQFSATGVRKPVVWTCNEPVLHLFYANPEIKKNKFVMRTLMHLEKFVVRAFVDEAVVADEYNFKRFQDIYGFTPCIVPYGIDYDFFSAGRPEHAIDKFKLNPDDFILLHVGMFSPLKNQKRSVEVVKNLVNKIPNIRLILVGHRDDKYYPTVKNLVSKLGLEDKITFLPHTNREDVRSLYKLCKILIHPVRPQGGWLAPFEAMCAGKLVMVSPEFTAADIIRKENIGIVTEKFEEKILEVYENSSKFLDMQMRASEYVRKNLNWERYSEHMIEIYKKAMEAEK